MISMRRKDCRRLCAIWRGRGRGGLNLEDLEDEFDCEGATTRVSMGVWL